MLNQCYTPPPRSSSDDLAAVASLPSPHGVSLISLVRTVVDYAGRQPSRDEAEFLRWVERAARLADHCGDYSARDPRPGSVAFEHVARWILARELPC